VGLCCFDRGFRKGVGGSIRGIDVMVVYTLQSK
jgi:hypothetical protein